MDTVRSDLRYGGGPGGGDVASVNGSTVMHAGIQGVDKLWRLWGALAVKKFAF